VHVCNAYPRTKNEKIEELIDKDEIEQSTEEHETCLQN